MLQRHVGKHKREQVAYKMENHKIDILCLQETHINTNSMEKVDGYTLIYYSGMSNKDRERQEKRTRTPEEEREKATETVKGKQQT